VTAQELLAGVRRVEVRTNRLVNDMMVGAYLSHFKGRGMDFEELREYMPGDDVRDIDWNVTNRMGKPFVKRFREERELAMALLLDVSASSAFGSQDQTKREFATSIAATLAVSAARSSDKVSLLLFSDQVELYVPPRKGRRHLLRIVREMLAHEPKGRGTDIPGALAYLNHVAHRRSIVFLLTDFLHSFGAWDAESDAGRDTVREIGLTNSRHDLVCVHLCDPREMNLPPAGLLTVEDAETGETLEVDSRRPSVRQAYLQANAGRLEELDTALRQSGVDTLRFDTGGEFQTTLQRFFETRRGRRSG
jgi:uncharacterized protein (DUF58 family)